ncbi:MAG: glycosyltransferase family 2 protein, partial [Ensifer adhaerens]
ISGYPQQSRAGYEEGALNLFYFLYQLVSDERRPQLTHEFLTRTGKWGLIRRRERYGLIAGVHAPWCSSLSLAAMRRMDALSRYLQSVPAANVLPRHGPF